MTRPARRTSSLGTAHPAAPSPIESVPAPATPPTEAPTKKSEPAPEGGKKKRANTATFYVDPEIVARARGAYRYTQGPEGYRSFSDFIVRALEAETARVEAKYNDGRPFDALEAGTLSPGPQAN
ncbi:hypothetical protein EXU48_23910 [Occultella glacieicola]|uniref:ParB-like C-terminal domain-containing protein n=1 Tax=Occultella glacieicola TaxID=2518684 RepID=A0ABY2DXE6_9MICO|nr:hypothetical protein [Occultella glacieicola]TDE88170.1 hypothetical protein EXU48_23910 [Occultella glacieicola]